MKEIRLWRVVQGNNPTVENLDNVHQTDTEELLEEILAHKPDLLLEGLTLIGRQTETAGGPLDLLGVDRDGQLVVFELKRGTLTRDAVAQIVDYTSSLSEMNLKELSTHIADRSGRAGIDKVDDFLIWYQEKFSKSLNQPVTPRMILVGLGADNTTHRMVSFLADGDLDISLITFHAFSDNENLFLSKQVEVESKPPPGSYRYTKEENLRRIVETASRLGVEDLFSNMADFFFESLRQAYQWPNPSSYSYSLSEISESGGQSLRVYISIYLSEPNPGKVLLRIQQKAIEAVGETFEKISRELGEKLTVLPDKYADIWIGSKKEWDEVSPVFEKLCPAIISGWEEMRIR